MKIRFWFATFFIAMAVRPTSQSFAKTPQTAEKDKFEYIHRFSKQAKLEDLRTFFYKGDDLELRFWSAPSMMPLSGNALLFLGFGSMRQWGMQPPKL